MKRWKSYKYKSLSEEVAAQIINMFDNSDFGNFRDKYGLKAVKKMFSSERGTEPFVVRIIFLDRELTFSISDKKVS